MLKLGTKEGVKLTPTEIDEVLAILYRLAFDQTTPEDNAFACKVLLRVSKWFVLSDNCVPFEGEGCEIWERACSEYRNEWLQAAKKVPKCDWPYSYSQHYDSYVNDSPLPNLSK